MKFPQVSACKYKESTSCCERFCVVGKFLWTFYFINKHNSRNIKSKRTTREAYEKFVWTCYRLNCRCLVKLSHDVRLILRQVVKIHIVERSFENINSLTFAVCQKMLFSCLHQTIKSVRESHIYKFTSFHSYIEHQSRAVWIFVRRCVCFFSRSV